MKGEHWWNVPETTNFFSPAFYQVCPYIYSSVKGNSPKVSAFRDPNLSLFLFESMKGGAPFGRPSFNRTTCNGYAFRAPTSVCWMQSTLRHKCCLGRSNSISLFCCYLGIIWHFLLHFIPLPSCGYFFYISAFAFLFFLFFSLFLFHPFNFFHCSRPED